MKTTKKVIALIRTSTTKQEVESQKQELIDFIKSDGISEENIIVVGHEGASAIKVDEAYLKNLQTVYDLIDGGNVASVYAWAIDRIGRNEIQLFTFKDKLVSNSIQLVIKNPNLRLLNADGSVNAGVELAFSLFATMAKQEMEAKKARFARAKKRNCEQGRYNGGKIHYGYTVNEEGKIIINEEEAEVVKLLFELYASDEYSTTKLTKELQSRGYKMRGKAISLHFTTNMLKSTAFVGYTLWNNVKRIYPRVISDELFESVQNRLSANHKGEITKQVKHTHLATKLIICPTCGRHWFASNRSYTCIGHKYHGQELQGYTTCENSDSVSIEWVDIAAWYVAKSCEVNYIYNFTESKSEEAAKQIEVNNQKIQVLNEKIDNIDSRRKRIALMFINEEITAEEQAKQSAKLKQDVANYKAEIVALEEENKKLFNLTQVSEEGMLIRMGRMPVSGIYENVEEAYKITHRHIQKITVEPFTYNGKTQKIITITTVLGEVKKFLYVAKSKVKHNNQPIKLYIENNGEFEPLIATADFVPCEM